jgi:uncharacterized protein (TIGR00255 family)
MIRSMTGYGKASGEYEGKTISVEIKSLNSKFFDLNLRLPQIYKDKEMELRSLFLKEVERGKLDVSVNIETDPNRQTDLLNRDNIKALLTDLEQLKKEFGLTDSNLLQIVMQMPMAYNVDSDKADEKEWNYVTELMQQALNNFKLFREREGKILENDISHRMNHIISCIQDIEPFERNRLNNVKQKLISALKQLEGNVDMDENRFEQELIYYLEKLDITEEKVRLAEHCRYFLSLLNDTINNGKKLGFIMQEIGREINTIGSKANDADIQRKVVDMKDEAEKIKEQLSNIL